jgi:hypothetical protein
MRKTRQMQIDEDACSENWMDKIATPETCNFKCSYGDLNDTYLMTLRQFMAIERWCA